VAKTPVGEIHLFDGDTFSQHNAFRSPGAPSIEDLRAKLNKAVYFKMQYEKMHCGIVAHAEYINASNVVELRDMEFVFLCIDRGGEKRSIVAKLDEYGIPFIDVGMGIQATGDSLGGILRVTTSTPEMRNHLCENGKIPFSEGDADNDYAQNIQVADLNALNAALAVIRWKKYFGFYRDLEKEHFSTYTIDGNQLMNEDRS